MTGTNKEGALHGLPVPKTVKVVHMNIHRHQDSQIPCLECLNARGKVTSEAGLSETTENPVTVKVKV